MLTCCILGTRQVKGKVLVNLLYTWLLNLTNYTRCQKPKAEATLWTNSSPNILSNHYVSYLLHSKLNDFLDVCRPLIRILGDRFPWQVKSAILSTLTIIITKGGIALKPFLPQLQTTFVKCLQDTNRSVFSSFSMSLPVMDLPTHVNIFELQVCPYEGCSCPWKA